MTRKQQISELKKEMKQLGVRVVSCFNAGLTKDEYYYNSLLFELKTKMEKGI